MRDPDGAGTAFLTDSPSQLAETVRQIAAAGAASVTPIVLHLRPGAREWFLAWLAEHYPDLVPGYRRMYSSGAYAPKDYQRRISACVADLAARYRVGSTTPAAARRLRHLASPVTRAADHARTDSPHGVQLSLL